MTKVGIIGNGKLGSLVAEAISSGKAPECQLVGIASRSLGVTPQDLIGMGAEIIIEAAKPDVLKAELIPILEAGVSVIPLSTGALADPEFLEAVKKAAREHKSRVILPHGAEGAFDLAATYGLFDEGRGTVVQYLSPKEKRIGTYLENFPEDFRGTALEGFSLSPGHLNVIIETSIACGGFDKTYFETRVPQDGKGGFSLELENEYAKAVLKTELKQGPAGMARMIAWSAVSALNRATSPVTF